MSSTKVLVVEDSKSVSLFISSKLESELGFEAVAAFSLDEAMQILQHDCDFFIAVLDLNLPDAPDGEIVDLVLSRQIPSIVLTASFDDDVRKRILSRSVVDYVVKQNPWSVEHVIRLIERFHRNQTIKVLVVDDSLSLRHHYRQLLETQRYDVFEATDGVDALKTLKIHPDIKLIITDCDMPRMDGLELVGQVRRRYNKEQMAIIGLSAKESAVLSAKFLKLGANDFLKKPFIIEEFYARVTQNIEMLELLESLREAAAKDALTKLFNRRYCLETGRKIFENALLSGSPLCVGLVDIDYFKKVNDTHGHDVGDIVLRHVAAFFQEAVREMGIACRFGGEEFCLLLPGMDRGGAKLFFEKIRVAVEKFCIECGSAVVRLTISIGVSAGPDSSLEAMIKRADEMLYQAKREGRNRVIISKGDV